MSIDPNMKLYGKYLLKDLCQTQTGLPNLPDNDAYIQNLIWLAKVLEQLEMSLGPFSVLSGFRTKAVQVAVSGKDSSLKSFHEVGMAVDIWPISDSIDAYFGKIISSEWRNKLGEIYIKPSQNSIHISLPTEKYRGVLKVLKNGSYVTMTEEEISKYMGPYVQSLRPLEYGNNDPFFSMKDPSGGMFNSLFTGPFGIYSTFVGSYVDEEILEEGTSNLDLFPENYSQKSLFVGGGIALAVAMAIAISLWT